MKRTIQLLAFPALCLFTVGTASGETPEQQLAKLPPAVQKSIGAEGAGATMVSIEPKQKEGGTRYKVVLNDHGKKRKFVVDSSGKLLSAKSEIGADALPAAVVKRAEAESQGAKIEKSSRMLKDGKTFYEVEFKFGGHERELVMDPSGEVMKTEDIVAFSSLPAPAKSQFEKLIGHGKLHKVEAIAEKGKPMIYEAEFESDGKKSEVKVGADGQILSRD
jgi:uncharacterized membrane protein YkoI